MPIKITRPGLFTTLQDQGRPGYRSIGIGPGGAMDDFAAAVANMLVNNKETGAVIEFHFPAGEILFEQDAIAGVTGADFAACLDGVPVATWKPLLVKKNQRLAFTKLVSGARCYLAIASGFIADQWLNSFSTHTRVKRGGYQGRTLKKEDVIEIGPTATALPLKPFDNLRGVVESVYQKGAIRFIQGPEWHLLSAAARHSFQQGTFLITPQSDRMGYRLKGIPLDRPTSESLVSSPVDKGTIQLLPDGQLILLMADHQTTGGYPRIAQVISADLARLAQSPISGELRFELVDIETAEASFIYFHKTLTSIKHYCLEYYALNRS